MSAPDSLSPSRVPYIVISFLALFLWIFIPYVIEEKMFPMPQEANDETTSAIYARRGQFGDMFGMVNSLFSAFAFIGAIYAVMMQREELASQRVQADEQSRLAHEQIQLLRDERKEAKRQAHLASLPWFLLESVFFENRVTITATNAGASIRSLTVFCAADIGVHEREVPYWRTDDRKTFHFDQMPFDRIPDRVIVFEFFTLRDEPQAFAFRMEYNKQPQPLGFYDIGTAKVI